MKRYIHADTDSTTKPGGITYYAAEGKAKGESLKKEVYDVIFYDAEEDDFNVQFQKYCTQAEIDAIVKKLNKENQVAGNYFAELA